jgi:hypothetical protein
MMRRWWSGALALVLLGGGVAIAEPITVTRTVLQKRSVFDLVAGKTDLRAACTGQQPIEVTYKRTAADVAAAVFTGLWYTPVHVRVTCASD